MTEEKRSSRSQRRKKLNILRFVAILAAFVLVVSAGYAGTKYIMSALFPSPSVPGSEDLEDQLPPEQMNLLLLGVDTRDGEEIARADSIIFVHADTAEQSVAILSIPRDTRVEIPHRGMDKINATTVYGGPEMTREVVSDLLGVPVPYHVIVDFNGFKEIVNILDGVNIDVETRMYYRDPRENPPLVIDLQPGPQRLDGDKAMQYVRYRGDGLADITRTQRQQKFLMALADEMLSAKTILKLPTLVPELNRNIQTNLGLKDMVRWAGLAKNLNNLQMVSGTLPGTFWDSGGLSYWYVDPEHAKVAFADLMDGNPITDPIDTEVRTPAPVVLPDPEEEEEAETELGLGPGQTIDDEGVGDPVESQNPADDEWGDGEPDGTVPGENTEPVDDVDNPVPDWAPVDENTSGVVDNEWDEWWQANVGQPVPGVGFENGSPPEDDQAVGG